MQIALNQDEIEAAVEMYLHSQINIAEGQEFSIDFTAGRGPNGLSAAIDIRSVAAAATRTPAPAPKAQPAAVKEPAPEPEVEEAETEQAAEEETASTETEEVADIASKPEADEEPEAKPVRKSGASIFSKAS